MNAETVTIGITGVLAALVAVWGIISQRAITRRQVTFDHLASLETQPHLVDAFQVFIALTKIPEGLQIYADRSKEASDEAKKILIVCNSYELIAIGIERGIIDYELYKRWQQSTVIRYWDYASPFVTALRSRTGHKKLFIEFQTMAGWFHDGSRPRGYRWGQWI